MNIRGRSAGRKGRKQRCQIVLGSVQASAVLAAAKRCMGSERVEVGFTVCSNRQYVELGLVSTHLVISINC